MFGLAPKRKCLGALLAALAIVMLVATLCPSRALADEAADAVAYSDDASGNRTYYTTVEAARSAGYEGATIVLAKDWDLTETFVVASGKALTIDMNGHKISNNGTGSVIRQDDNSKLALTSGQFVVFDFKGYNEDTGEACDTRYPAGGLVTGGCSYDAGGIQVDANSTLTLNNVAVGGNSGMGGGIRINGGCTLSMVGSAVLHNKNSNGSGGGIYVGGEDCNVTLDSSMVGYNYASSCGGGIFSGADGTRICLLNNATITDNTALSGGGIFLNKSWFCVQSPDKTGSVCSNVAKGNFTKNVEDGAGIFVSGTINYDKSGSTIQNLIIQSNHSDVDGGGIYLSQKNTRVIGCNISGNEAVEDGGGVYVDASGCSIENCQITENANNTCGKNYEGGGVFVSYKYDLGLAGKCTITGNTRGRNGSADDLFLNANVGNTARAYLTGSVDAGSSIGIRTGITGFRTIMNGTSPLDQGIFFMDLKSFNVAYSSDGSHLYQVP